MQTTIYHRKNNLSRLLGFIVAVGLLAMFGLILSFIFTNRSSQAFQYAKISLTPSNHEVIPISIKANHRRGAISVTFKPNTTYRQVNDMLNELKLKTNNVYKDHYADNEADAMYYVKKMAYGAEIAQGNPFPNEQDIIKSADLNVNPPRGDELLRRLREYPIVASAEFAIDID